MSAVHAETPDRAMAASTPMSPPPGRGTAAGFLFDPSLHTFAALVDDLETVRKSADNRLRQLTCSVEDADGEVRGFGLTDDHPAVAAQRAIVDGLKTLEHQADLDLRRAMRKHPLGPWVKAQKGLGSRAMARLLGAVGDPYWHTLHSRPRTVSELWAYAGLHVIDGAGARRRKGAKSNWSNAAKMRAYLVAVDCLKQPGSSYEQVYRQRRLATAERLHQSECVRCGPSGKPAQYGTPWSKAHQHADALRVASKAVLRDLWRESARIYGATS